MTFLGPVTVAWRYDALCDPCWTALGLGEPLRVVAPRPERCRECGCITEAGIYLRRPE